MAKDKTLTKTARKYVLYVAILLIVAALTVYFVMKNDPGAVIDAIKTCDWRWILAAFGMMLVVYLLEGGILTVLCKMYKRNYPFFKGVLNTFIGVFFSDITPSNTGGQFVQAYTFSKQGIKITNAASVLFMHFIIYQVVVVVYSAVIFIFKFSEMRALTQTIQIAGISFDMISLSLVGFGINFFVLFSLIFLAFSEKIHTFVIKYGIGLGAKLHLIKNKEDQILKLNTKVETFRIESRRLLQNWPIMIATILLFVIKLTLLNSIPYFIARAMGLEFAAEGVFRNLVDTTSMTTLVSSITQMVPIPGGSGGAELVFNYMFGGTFFTNATGSDISALILLWRSVTFYLGLIIGFIVFVSYHESPKKDSFMHGDNKTLLELHVINIDDMNNEKKKTEMNLGAVSVAEAMNPSSEMVTVDDIEKRFAALKAELNDQLEKNEETIEKEEKTGKKPFRPWRKKK